MWNALFKKPKICSANTFQEMPGEGLRGGAEPRESVQVAAGYLHRIPAKREGPEACPKCGGAEGRKHLGDAAEPHCPV